MSPPLSRCPLRPIRYRLALMAALFSATVQASEPDYLTFEQQDTPATTSELVEPLQAILRTPQPRREDRPTPAWKQNAAPFWRDSTLLLKPRSYYLNRDRQRNSDNEAWALGGALAFTSGRWLDRFDIGATLYTSQKLYGPEDKGGTLLLKPVQQSFTTLGEAWVGIRLYEQNRLRIGRQTFNLPYINRRDTRMVPNSFEGVAISRPAEQGFAYIAGYLSRIKGINQTCFVSMSEAAGADGEHNGLAMAGARYNFGDKTLPNSTIGAICSHCARASSRTFW